MICILRLDNGIAYFSPFAEELTGYTAGEALAQDFSRFLPESHYGIVADEIRRIFAGTPSRGFETPILCKDGSRRWMVWNAERLEEYEGQPGLLAVGQDITPLKQAQEQAVQAERLAAIGQMMTGLAHESGNALARSQSCLEMLTWEVEDRPEALDLIQRIQKAQDHLKQLYEDVRNYAAPIRLERDVWDVSGIWRQAWENLAMRRQARDASVSADPGGGNLHCNVDPFRLEQVFRNIFENSLAACADPVRIKIRSTPAWLDGRSAVQIAVQDNGPGLSPEQRQRIFDPFFTTKTKGTGLGMAIAKRILEAHHGRIAVGPAVGGGAEILISLPRAAP
jgi:two-component system sensor kinase FixL